jgi:hypothetical protein
MTAPSHRPFLNRFGWLIFFPTFITAASLPLLPALGIRGALAFALLALGWLVYGRLLVFACFAFIVTELSSVLVSRVFCSALVDGAAVYVICRIDVHLLWGAAVAIVLSEAVVWWVEKAAARISGHR